MIAESQRQRRGHAIEIELSELDHTTQGLRQQCDAEVAQLQDRKRYASNNLAGATWEVSLSNEMAAIATRCDTKQRDLAARREALARECAALGTCKQ